MVFQAARPLGSCTVCEAPANVLRQDFGWGTVVDCSRCGDYSVEHVTCDDVGLPLGDAKRRALASHLIRKLQNGRRPVLTTDFFRSLEDRDLPTAAEASDSLLLWFAESADGNLGKFNPINPSDQALQASIGVISATDLIYVSDALKDQGLVENMQGASSAAIRLTPNGWLRVEELKRAHIASKYAFFARKFDNPDLDRVFNECLRPAVAATGYELRSVTQRAGLVDAVIEDEIRRCRFLIADLSDDNAGAYWEAGLAEGLGKPVIYVCRAKVGADEKRTHFDANHRHTVRWDLSTLDQTAAKLKAVIRNTLLGDATQDDDPTH
jgi:hypothetical protein